MPSYKTHAIHGEIILPKINTRIEINKEDLKSFCMGPDALIVTDYRLFELQHIKDTRDYFKTLLKLIKKEKLQDKISKNDKTYKVVCSSKDMILNL